MVPPMGFLDKLFGRAKDTAGDAADKAEPTVDKAQDAAGDAWDKASDVGDDATGGRFYDAVEKADEEAGELLERLHLEDEPDGERQRPGTGGST